MTWIGPLAALLSSVTWAIGSSGYSKISRDHSPFTVNFTRAAFALPCFLVASLLAFGGLSGFSGELARVSPAQVGWLGLSMFASYAFGDSLFLWSTRSLGVPGALAISSIFPVWTAFAGYLAFGERLNLAQGAGLLVAVGGVITVILNEPRSHADNGPRARGESRRLSGSAAWSGTLIAFTCSIFWAMNSYSVARGGRGVSALAGNSVRMMMALPLCGIMSAIFRSRPDQGQGARAAGGLLLPGGVVARYAWLFFLETFGGTLFFFYGLCHSRLAVASTLSSLAPVVSVPVALTLKIERFSLGRTSGVCLVVIGLCLLMGAG